jgi:hypothetical protein
MIHAAILVVSTLAIPLLAPLELGADAHGSGFGAHSSHFTGIHSSHFPGHFRSARHNEAFGQWPLFGGLVAVPPDASDNIVPYATPETVVFVPESQRALSCHHSQQTLTVPSEDGGTRQITITRC